MRTVIVMPCVKLNKELNCIELNPSYTLQDRTAENERKVRRKIGRIRKHVGGKTADVVPSAENE